MARALFLIAKRAWYAEQLTPRRLQKRPIPDPPPAPIPGEGWIADPAELQVQLEGVTPPDHAGTSVKIDPGAVSITRSFRPRPFLVVSNELLLDQGLAWVCVCSTTVKPYRGGRVPEWVVPIPELETNCLCLKLHTVRTSLPSDPGLRELLRPMEPRPKGVISTRSAARIRETILRLIDGDFAPSGADDVPPGTVVRGHENEHLVIASCDISMLYRGATALATTVLLEREPIPVGPDGRAEPGVVPVVFSPDPQNDSTDPTSGRRSGSNPDAQSQGFADLASLRSKYQPVIINDKLGAAAFEHAELRSAVEDLLLG